MKYLNRVWLVLVVVMALAVAIPVQAQEPETVRFLFPKGTVRFEYPATWLIEVWTDGVYAATSQTAMDFEDPSDIPEGDYIAQISDPAGTFYSFETNDLNEALSYITEFLPPSGDVLPVDVNGLPGKRYDFDSEGLAGTALALMGGEEGTILVAFATGSGGVTDAMRAEWEAVINSIQYMLPAPPDMAALDAITPQNAAMLYAARQYATFDGDVYALAVTADGTRLAVAYDDWEGYDEGESDSPYFARVFDVASGDEVLALSPVGSVYSLAFTPDDAQLVIGQDEEPYVQVVDLATGEVVLEPEMPAEAYAGAIPCLAISPDGSLLAAGTWGGDVLVWNAADGSLAQQFSITSSSPEDLAFSPDGSLLALAGSDDPSVVWNLATGEVMLELTMPIPEGEDWSLHEVAALAFSPDGSLLAIGLDYEGVYDWDNYLELDPASHYVELYDTASGELVLTTEAALGEEGNRDLVFSPDGSFLVGGSDGYLDFWDVASGALLESRVAGDDYIEALVFNPAGTGLFVGLETWPGTVDLWVVMK